MTGPDLEIAAMEMATEFLDQADAKAQARFLAWLTSRYAEPTVSSSTGKYRLWTCCKCGRTNPAGRLGVWAWRSVVDGRYTACCVKCFNKSNTSE